jgi:glucose/arabinose dehydrogenase
MRLELLAPLTIPLAAGAALAASQQAPVDPTLEIEIVVEGLSRPISLAFIGPDEFLVGQKDDGRVLHVRDGVVLGTVLDVAVDNYAERGLLSIVTDPDFVNNALVYLHYTEGPGPGDSTQLVPLGNRTYRYRWNGGALVEPELILDLPSHGVHNGGVLAFGPDDRLYLVAGDRSHCCEWWGTGLLHNDAAGHGACDGGVIFRVTSDGDAPSDNPFFDPADLASPMNRYFAYGIRNSFGIGFDPASGALWQTEAGPETFDELNRIERGTNGGWFKILGFDDLDPEGTGDLWFAPGATYRDPVFAWRVPTTPTAVGFIETPKLGCGYRNDLVVGVYSCRVIYRFELDQERTTVVLTTPELADRIADNTAEDCTLEQQEILFAVGPETNSDSSTDIDTGPDGLLYFVSYSHGTVYRIQPAPGAWPDADGDRVDDACDCSTTDGSAYGFAQEVPRIRVAGKTRTTLGWNAQAAMTGPGTRYAVVTGTLAGMHGAAGFAGACTLAAGLAVPSAPDVRAPSPGDGFYYLVRAENACGAGTFGAGTPRPDPRDPLDRQQPAPCSPPATPP